MSAKPSADAQTPFVGFRAAKVLHFFELSKKNRF